MSAETVLAPWDGEPFTIRLAAYTSPPLRNNDRMNRHARARIVKAVRQTAAWTARAVWPYAPIDRPCRVVLFWEVPDNRVRDANAADPTCKAAVDGFVDAGVFVGDRHHIVKGQDCRIDVCGSKGVRIEISAA